MVEINWTNLAIKDLNDIGDYIAKDSESQLNDDDKNRQLI